MHNLQELTSILYAKDIDLLGDQYFCDCFDVSNNQMKSVQEIHEVLLKIVKDFFIRAK